MNNKDTIEALNNRYAYVYRNGGNPIYNPEQMLPGKPLVCQPPDDEWQNRINADCWWASGYKGSESGNQSDMALMKKLLSFGGYEACVQYHEEDAKNLLERGQLWYEDHSVLKKGAPSQCHRNTCDLWEANHADREVAIATGYALTDDDGMWRQHTWLLHRRVRSVQVVETTTKRIAYFGFVMTDEEARKFCSDNF